MIFKRNKSKKKGKKKSWKLGDEVLAFLDGRVFQRLVLKHLNFLGFCVVLCFLYIGNRYANEALIHKIDRAKIEVTKLRHKSITVSSQLMAISSPSQVQRIVDKKHLGLEFSNDPPKIIED